MPAPRAIAPADARVLDLKGWAMYYADRPGYSFADYTASGADPGLRYVVAHDAFLIGEWPYCQAIRDRVGGRPPIASFPDRPKKGVSRVHVFDLTPDVARAGDSATH